MARPKTCDVETLDNGSRVFRLRGTQLLNFVHNPCGLCRLRAGDQTLLVTRRGVDSMVELMRDFYGYLQEAGQKVI